MGLVITQDKRLCAAFLFVLFLINNSTQDLESSNLVAEPAFIACGSIALLFFDVPCSEWILNSYPYFLLSLLALVGSY
jgi:hypothetical protein